MRVIILDSRQLETVETTQIVHQRTYKEHKSGQENVLLQLALFLRVLLKYIILRCIYMSATIIYYLRMYFCESGKSIVES